MGSENNLLEIYDIITAAFEETMTPDGKVRSIQFGEAARHVAPVYDRIFGHGIMSNHLKNDILGHANGVIQAALEDPIECEYVEPVVTRILGNKYGNSNDVALNADMLTDSCALIVDRPTTRVRGKWSEGIFEILWTKRALDFILRFLEYGVLIHTDLSLHDCASKAYAEVLKPYHGFMVSSIVSLAFSLTSSREQFLKALGFSELSAAQRKLKSFLNAAKPVITEVDRILVEKGCDFPEKV